MSFKLRRDKCYKRGHFYSHKNFNSWVVKIVKSGVMYSNFFILHIYIIIYIYIIFLVLGYVLIFVT